MSDLRKAMSSEALKLKRTLALRLAIGAPLAVVVLNFVMYSQRRLTANEGLNPRFSSFGFSPMSKSRHCWWMCVSHGLLALVTEAPDDL